MWVTPQDNWDKTDIGSGHDTPDLVVDYPHDTHHTKIYAQVIHMTYITIRFVWYVRSTGEYCQWSLLYF